jgi:thiosulfate/3-mercaptopyruvate sulfurtransferase
VAVDGSQFHPFLSAAELERSLDRLVLADVRSSPAGRAAHLDASLPGAVRVDLDEVLAGPPSASAGRHPLPDAEVFARHLGELGIPFDQPVVAYDGGPGAEAARLVWMLRVIGQPAALLDGGLAAWRGATQRGGAVLPAVERPVVPWPPDRVIDVTELEVLRGSPDVVVIDARAAERFRGETEPIDRVAGRIPGAVNVPFSDNLRDDRLLPEPQLRSRYEQVGALSAGTVVAYCGSGVTACLDLLALDVLGVDGCLFPGSWSAWIGDPLRPVARGPADG